MKGTLLLLALLVIGELGFQTTEACIPFTEAFLGIASGSKIGLNVILSKFDPTAKEREAFEKIQQCYNEAGLKAKLLDSLVLSTITLSKDCREYYTAEVREKISTLLSKFKDIGK